MESAAISSSESVAARFLALIDKRPFVVLPVWIVAYFAVLWKPAHRPLWYDELFTYYVAMAPTWERFLGCLRHVDLNPPFGYPFVRASIALFGDTPMAARIPAMIAFLAASLIACYLVSRRLGGAFGLTALGVFWCFSLTAFAVESRFYALIILLFSIASLCWLNAADSRGWTIWHAGLAASLAAMFLTHCFSPPYGVAIGVGEIVRSRVTKRIDKRMWIAILAPLCVLPAYLPLVRNAQSILTPHAFEASLFTIPQFYVTILLPMAPLFAFLGLAWFSGRGKGPQIHWLDIARPHEIAFCIAGVLSPLITMAYCIHSGVPFWPRHGAGAVFPATLIIVALLAKIVKRSSQVAIVVSILILFLFCWTKPGIQGLMDRFESPSTAYRSVRTDLPFVAASGLTFLEMDHREDSGFVGRLYYLTDHESATRYHSTIFEGFPILKQWVPVRANVQPYHDFTAKHRQFLVLGTPDFPEDWLLSQLAHDGAQIRVLAEMKTGYRDRSLFEVTLR